MRSVDPATNPPPYVVSPGYRAVLTEPIPFVGLTPEEKAEYERVRALDDEAPTPDQPGA